MQQVICYSLHLQAMYLLLVVFTQLLLVTGEPGGPRGAQHLRGGERRGAGPRRAAPTGRGPQEGGGECCVVILLCVCSVIGV